MSGGGGGLPQLKSLGVAPVAPAVTPHFAAGVSKTAGFLLSPAASGEEARRGFWHPPTGARRYFSEPPHPTHVFATHRREQRAGGLSANLPRYFFRDERLR